MRPQYAHIIDMVPTLLDLLGIEPPATIRGVTQSPIQGTSFAHTLDDAEAATHHHTQYFEMLGHRSIYHDGWRAVCPWPGPSFAEAGVGFGQPISADRLSELDATAWELYHVAEDFAETHDLAAEHRDKLIALIGLWYAEAGKYDVLPDRRQRPGPAPGREALGAVPRDRYVYRPGTQSVPFNAAPRVLSRPHSITAERRDPRRGGRGGAALPGQRGRRLLPLRAGRAAALRAQLRGTQPAQGVLAGSGAPRARTSSASSSSRRASPTWPAGWVLPAASSSTWTARWWPTRRPRRPRRSCSTPAR